MLLVTCPAYPALEHGSLNYNKDEDNGRYPFNTRVNLDCHYPYTLSGPHSSLCVVPGNWNSQTSSCYLGNEINLL